MEGVIFSGLNCFCYHCDINLIGWLLFFFFYFFYYLFSLANFIYTIRCLKLGIFIIDAKSEYFIENKRLTEFVNMCGILVAYG